MANVKLPPTQFNDDVVRVLEIESGEAAYSSLKVLVDNYEGSPRRGVILACLKEMDKFFYQIHPRALHHPGMAYSHLSKRHWLRRLQAVRLTSGCYASINGRLLIPKGPLTRIARPASASSAYCFKDNFSALSVVTPQSSVDEVPISINIIAKAAGAIDGVIGEGIYKDRVVAFMPVAEEALNIDVVKRDGEGVSFVDFKAAKSFDVPKKVKEVLQGMSAADIVVAPELVISEVDSRSIASDIRGGKNSFRFFLAGTGHTEEQCDDQSWNEARVYNELGKVLWTQRKIWLADIPPHRAVDMGLGKDKRFMEDNVSGHELTIGDFDGFGRCIILICQDINSAPLAEYVIRHYQPDWVFVPILDVGVSVGRWFHQQLLHLVTLSPARFLVVSSLSLADRAKKNDVACGMAMGPQDHDEDNPRAVCFAKIDKSDEVGKGCAIVDWANAWGETRICLKDPKK
ncbi:hypothetical protein [Pseudomonas chlororaphis]|uniref:hypothetical protein n=1 Tax=Pseudomonas chlororaphis TaxID=587753 RepID=UPI001473C688|nr:hypothetical protein [Pseudomonas chlororaphis]NNB46324.1 hypothetical protein [Pseudomonas chlororaphis]